MLTLPITINNAPRAGCTASVLLMSDSSSQEGRLKKRRAPTCTTRQQVVLLRIHMESGPPPPTRRACDLRACVRVEMIVQTVLRDASLPVQYIKAAHLFSHHQPATHTYFLNIVHAACLHKQPTLLCRLYQQSLAANSCSKHTFSGLIIIYQLFRLPVVATVIHRYKILEKPEPTNCYTNEPQLREVNMARPCGYIEKHVPIES